MISLAELIKDRPLTHTGRSRTMGIHPDLARFLDETLKPGHVTCETGSGLSTLVILPNKVAQHIAISPDPDEFEAIRSFCQEHSFDTGPLRAVVARFQAYWLVAGLAPLDLVLIDGDHAFPMPFIDWFYTAETMDFRNVRKICVEVHERKIGREGVGHVQSLLLDAGFAQDPARSTASVWFLERSRAMKSGKDR